MIWKVFAVLPFDEQDEATDFYHDCQVAIAKAKTINPGQPNEQRGIIQLEECHHDLMPPDPCALIDKQTTPA